MLEPATRPYRSERRSRQAASTRADVLQAGTTLFAAQGWAGTSMRGIARAADVAVETIYATFGSKADLLRAVLDVAIVGDDRPVALAERPEYHGLTVGSMAERAAAAAELLANINTRAIGIEKALEEAAASDPALAERLASNDEARRLGVSQGAESVAGRPLSDVERDGVWAVVSPNVYDLLVTRSRWSVDAYRAWLADTILRLLIERPPEERRGP